MVVRNCLVEQEYTAIRVKGKWQYIFFIFSFEITFETI